MNMTPQVARRLEYPDAEGVIIQSIAAGSSAQRAGMQEGWVIESLNGTRIENTRDLERAASELRAGGAVSVIVRDATGARRIFNYRVRG